MSESDIIARTPSARTARSLLADLKTLGVDTGDTVICHSSMAALGWVAGEAQAVIAALCDAVGTTGTIVMPAHSGHLSDPAHWQNPPVPTDWIETIRAEMPAYDPATTPTRGMGVIAEQFRTWPGVRRSHHPTLSFAALGPLAGAVTARQPFADPLGADGPLGALYELDAKVLLLGVDFENCTALHLAERLAAPLGPREPTGSPIQRDGERVWVAYDAPVLRDNDLLADAGADYEATGAVRLGRVGSAESRLLAMRGLVDHAIRLWWETP